MVWMQELGSKAIKDMSLVKEDMFLVFEGMEPFRIPDCSRDWDLVWLEEPDVVEIACTEACHIYILHV